MATEIQRFRAVLDTNVIIAALKSQNPNSPTAELLRRWHLAEFTLLYSSALRAEYEEKLVERKIDPQRAEEFLRYLEQTGELIEVNHIEPVIEADPDDDIVVATAVIGQAAYLVTYDPHFFILGENYHGLQIIDGLHFLFLVRGDTSAEN